jgi:hypothetical protein
VAQTNKRGVVYWEKQRVDRFGLISNFPFEVKLGCIGFLAFLAFSIHCKANVFERFRSGNLWFLGCVFAGVIPSLLKLGKKQTFSAH